MGVQQSCTQRRPGWTSPHSSSYTSGTRLSIFDRGGVLRGTSGVKAPGAEVIYVPSLFLRRVVVSYYTINVETLRLWLCTEPQVLQMTPYDGHLLFVSSFVLESPFRIRCSVPVMDTFLSPFLRPCLVLHLDSKSVGLLPEISFITESLFRTQPVFISPGSWGGRVGTRPRRVLFVLLVP